MNPGELKHGIVISAPTPELDPKTLGYVPGARTVFDGRAAVKGMRMGEEVAAGAERLNQMIQFTIRWRSDLDTSMSIRYQGRDYGIEYIDPTPFDRCYMRIRAVYRGGVGQGGAENGQGAL